MDPSGIPQKDSSRVVKREIDFELLSLFLLVRKETRGCITLSTSV